MSSFDTLNDREKIKVASREGRLDEVIELSAKFSNDVELLSETLIESCYSGHLRVVNWLIEHTDADVNYTGVISGFNVVKEETNYSLTPLTAACERGHLLIVKFLVETTRVDVNLPDSGKWKDTPLIRACYRAHVSVAKYLLRVINNLDVNIADDDGYTALHWAISSCRNRGHTPLHEACIEGDDNKVVALVFAIDQVNDYTIDTQNNLGYTPLHFACYFGRRNIVITLMIAGADETIVNDDWKTPAKLMVEKGHEELLELLDRVSLIQVLKASKVMKKLSVSISVILILKLIRRLARRNEIRKKWLCALKLINILLAKNNATVSSALSAYS